MLDLALTFGVGIWVSTQVSKYIFKNTAVELIAIGSTIGAVALAVLTGQVDLTVTAATAAFVGLLGATVGHDKLAKPVLGKLGLDLRRSSE